MRTLVPAETLVYLETNDLAAALQPIVDSKPFGEAAKSKPDLSALKGVQLAVAITGFETREEKLTDEHSVGRVQPHFVAVADTHAWNYQAAKFAEMKLGSFVAKIYDSEPTLESSDKNGGKYFIWTAKDGRKAFAQVVDSVIFFGNDESAIDKCLAVRRGEADSIIKTGKIKPADPATLAAGYVSTDGIAQLANIIGLKFATEAGEDGEVQSAIAGIVPQLLRGLITEISWTSTKTEKGIEDKYSISMPPDVANVFNETMAANEDQFPGISSELPADIPTATFYKFKNAQVAWRSLLLVTQKLTAPLGARVITEFSRLLTEPYGIADAEVFFGAGTSEFVTANFSPDGEKPVLIASFIDGPKVERSLIEGLRRPANSPDFDGLRKSSDGDAAAYYLDATIVTGEAESVERLAPKVGPRDDRPKLRDTMTSQIDPKYLCTTTGREFGTTALIAEMIAEKKGTAPNVVSTYVTETRFTRSGLERRTVSDLGLIGSIIAQLGQE